MIYHEEFRRETYSANWTTIILSMESGKSEVDTWRYTRFGLLDDEILDGRFTYKVNPASSTRILDRVTVPCSV